MIQRYGEIEKFYTIGGKTGEFTKEEAYVMRYE